MSFRRRYVKIFRQKLNQNLVTKFNFFKAIAYLRDTSGPGVPGIRSPPDNTREVGSTFVRRPASFQLCSVQTVL